MATRIMAWLLVMGLAVCSAISIEDWGRHFDSDITVEFQTNAQLLEYNTNLLQLNRHASKKLAMGSETRQKRHFVLDIDGSKDAGVHERLRDEIVAAGGTYQPAVRGGRYAVVTADVDTISRLHLQMQDALRGVVHMRGGMKISRSVNELACEGNGEGKGEGEERKGLLVMLQHMGESSFQESISWLQQLGSEHGWSIEAPSAYHAKSSGVVGVGVGCSSLRESALLLAELEWVRWIEPRPTFRLLNYYSQGITQGGSVDDTPLYKANITGQDEIVGCSDSGIDLDHCFFEDVFCDPMDTLDTSCRKVVFYQTSSGDLPDLDDSGHGTHVAGSIAGSCSSSCSSSKKYHGMAYNARLAFIDLSNTDGESVSIPGDLYTDLFQVLYDQGAKIQSHSWGSSPLAMYPSAAREADQFMYDNPDALILFAAGNDGEDGPSTVLSPGLAKNIVTVGASLNAYESFPEGAPSRYNEKNVAEFSSRGPTQDGRLKPDICAPGQFVISALNVAGSEPVCGSVDMAGTSMATPVTAGNAALAREYFRAGYYPSGVRNADDSFNPSGALLKAVMVHSARRMDGRIQGSSAVPIDYPGFEQGYGRLRLGDVLHTSENNYFTLIVKGDVNGTDTLLSSQGEQHTVTVQTVGDSSFRRALAVTLVWNDPVSLLSPDLLNDLDLFITNEDTGEVFRPLWVDTGDVKDSMNPVEKVVIDQPALLGNYTITVKAAYFTPPQVPQTYALVITGTFEGNEYDKKPKDDDKSQFQQMLDKLGLTQQEFTIGVTVIVVLGLFSWCCDRRRRKRQDRDRAAYHADEVL